MTPLTVIAAAGQWLQAPNILTLTTPSLLTLTNFTSPPSLFRVGLILPNSRFTLDFRSLSLCCTFVSLYHLKGGLALVARPPLLVQTRHYSKPGSRILPQGSPIHKE